MRISRKVFSDPKRRDQLRESVFWLRKHVHTKPTIGIILGSGLGDFADRLHQRTSIPSSDIPNYPSQTVEGHRGKVVFGTIVGKQIVAFQGRVHFYETGDLYRTLFPIYVAYGLGVNVLLITNAAGGIRRTLHPGDFMIITDQINLTFEDPLQFILNKELVKNGSLYDGEMQSLIEEVAYERGIPTCRGIYCGVKGPSYETAAEVEMVRRLRADAVGMSTVNEVTLAHVLGMKVAGISCITNLATGISSRPLSHRDVTTIGNKVKKRFEILVEGVIGSL